MKREAVQEERQKNKDGKDEVMSPGGTSHVSHMDEYSQAQQSMLDLIEDATLTPDEKLFLDKLVDYEARWYPGVEQVVETVSFLLDDSY
jgi:hypothetical protein